ncbi:MAG: YhcH/YjgK/YiaL family protein [bacterium]
MIFDSLNNFTLYKTIHPHFPAVGQFLCSPTLTALQEGRVEITPDGSYAMISEYSTQEMSECFIEAHQKFIDIHVVLRGKEIIGICQAEQCRRESYDEAKDFQKLQGTVGTITLNEGQFAIFFPQDGHMPKIKQGDQGERIKKLVVKIPVQREEGIR